MKTLLLIYAILLVTQQQSYMQQKVCNPDKCGLKCCDIEKKNCPSM